MTNDTYLSKVLAAQTLSDDSAELKALQQRRAEVETLLREHFKNSSPTIRYGGSKAKGTMIRESYDLDIVCYFPHDDTSAGATLEDIYNNVAKALDSEYLVERKSSALRLKDLNPQSRGVDFHIDVVPGRFTDDKQSDTFIYISTGEKRRLKTNLDVHVKHVRDSGVIDAIRLTKLWKVRNGLPVRNFILELAVIKLLKSKKNSTLSAQLEHVWTEFRDNIDELSVEDPANPTGNDLSDLLAAAKWELSAVAGRTLALISSSGWEAVFGPVEEKSSAAKVEVLQRAAAAVAAPTRPWCRDA